MTTLPALPLPDMETGEDASISQLVSSSKQRLEVKRSASGDWILSPSNDLNAADLRHGVEALERQMEGGPIQRIAAAVLRLMSATRRPQWMDDGTAAVSSNTLQEALLDYPIDVVEAACAAWRRGPNGQYWPAEKELRNVCEDLFKSRRELRDHAKRLLHAMEARSDRAGRRSLEPSGATRRFVDAASAAHGSGFAKSWLSHRTCEFTADTIFTIGLGVDRLHKECFELIRVHGIKLEMCPNVTRRFYDEQDMAQAEGRFPENRQQKRGRR